MTFNLRKCLSYNKTKHLKWFTTDRPKTFLFKKLEEKEDSITYSSIIEKELVILTFEKHSEFKKDWPNILQKQDMKSLNLSRKEVFLIRYLIENY